MDKYSEYGFGSSKSNDYGSIRFQIGPCPTCTVPVIFRKMYDLFIFTSLATCKRSKDCLTLEGQRGSSSLSSLTTWSTAASVAVIGTSLWIKIKHIFILFRETRVAVTSSLLSLSHFQATVLYFQHFDLSSDPDLYTHHGLSNRTSENSPIKKKSKFSSNIRIQFKWDQLQSHICGWAS